MSASAGVQEIGASSSSKPPKITGKLHQGSERSRVEHGQEIFRSLCFACHGFDGNGMPMPGREGVTLAPPLVGIEDRGAGRLASSACCFTASQARSMERPTKHRWCRWAQTPTQWIADVACYIRKAFGNHGPLVAKDDVKRLRDATKSRTLPWTIEELRAGFPQPLANPKDWKLTASTEKDLAKAVDGDTGTRWTTGKFQAPGQWFEIELPAETEIAGVLLDTVRSGNDYPRGYTVEVSSDGAKWSAPMLKGAATGAITELMFPKAVKTKFIRLTQTGSAKGNYWSIHEVQLLQPVKPAAPKTAAK